MKTPYRQRQAKARVPLRAPKRKIGLLIVGQQNVLRAGVRNLIESAPDVAVVGEAVDLGQAIQAVQALPPDVVLLNLESADAAEVDGMRRLRRALGDAALVVMGRHEDDEEVFRAVAGGAAGHVGGNAGADELAATIREAAAGEEPIQRTIAARPAVARRVLETFAELASSAAAPVPADLSEREQRILELAAEGKTNQEIGREIGLSEHTVKGAISQLLVRLRLRHRTQAVVHALRLGWIRPPRSPRSPRSQ